MLSTRKVTSVLTALLAVAFISTNAAAQEEITLDFAGGIGIPASDLADFQDAGPALDIGLNYQLHPRFSLRVSGGASILDGAKIDDAFDQFVAQEGLADFSLVNFNGGGVLHVLPDDPRWTLDVNLGGGVMILTSERQELSGVPRAGGGFGTIIIDISETYFDITAGVDLGYKISDQVSFFIGGDGHLFSIDEKADSVEDLNRVSPSLSAPETGWVFPVAAGVRFHFQP